MREWSRRVMSLAVAGTVALAAGCQDKAPGAQGTGSEWQPPGIELGPPGWRESVEPWEPAPAPEGAEYVDETLSIWSYEGGVYLLHLRRSLTAGVPDDWALHFNDGTGWRLWFGPQPFDAGPVPGLVRGFPDGSPLLVGRGSHRAPAMRIVDGAVVEEPTPQLHSAFVLNQQRAYAIVDEPDSRELYLFDGAGWHPMAPALPAQPLSIWADEESLFVAADDEFVYWLDAGDNEWQNSGREIVDHEAQGVWGQTTGIVWVAADNNALFHFNDDYWCGDGWPIPLFRTDEEVAIRALWGAEESIYFNAGAVLGEINGFQISVVADWGVCNQGVSAECDWRLEILDLWGNHANSLFLATVETQWTDPDVERRARVLWYDGTLFYEM